MKPPLSPAAMSERDADQKAPSVGYIRVSSSEQVQHGYGLTTQRETITQYCLDRDIPLLKIYEDGGFSGAEISNRRALQQLLADARDKNKSFKRVLTCRIDRIGRNTLHVLTVQYELNRFGVQLHSISEPHDWQNPTERVFLTLLASVGELDRSIVCQRLISGRRKVAELNKWPGGRIPFGFSRSEDGRLIPCESEAQVVSKIMRWRYSRLSFQIIADRLNEMGITTRSKKKWDSSSVSYVSRNPAIRGNFRAFGTVKKNSHEAIIR
jgi:site-specific DNA recombinase